jgi:hypothetical protein
MYHLCKSVWAFINEGVVNGADLSIVSPRCRLHDEGYAGLYTPDIQLWAVIHAITNADTSHLTTRTGHTITTADLKKMVKVALCSGNYFQITPAELANGKYKLPHLVHYDGALDMDAIVKWLRTTIGLTPYMVHAHFQPFLHQAFETTKGASHQHFSPTDLLPEESPAPRANESLIDFPADCKWTPNHGPRGRLLPTTNSHPKGSTSVSDPSMGPTTPATGSTTNASSDPLGGVEDTKMVDSGATIANAPLVASQSTII